jgi:GntR family transcriptional regulator/MocR family aminotransferase
MGLSLPIALTRDRDATLQEQIYRQVRDGILAGSLGPGLKLPSSRDMANELAVSRNTVALAFDWLASEGYVESRVGAGTFVAGYLPEAALDARTSLPPSPQQPASSRRTPVTFTGRMPASVGRDRPRLGYDFWYGRLDRREFPVGTWRRLILENLSRAGANLSDYGHPAGDPELRAAIASHLGATRGMLADPERIVITAGAQDGLSLLCRILVGNGSRVVVEDPCYDSAALLFQSHGATLQPVPIDSDGLITASLPAGGDIALAYVTPSHQFPTGVTLPLDRRLALLAWAAAAGAYVVEDDYDSDFRYDSPPLTALSGLDRDHRVIYLGSFSKSIGAGLRLGYLVLPPELVAPAIAAKSLASYGQPWLDQAVVADFLNTGAHRQHLRRMLKTYRVRRDLLVNALAEMFGPDIRLTGADAGMHLMWHLPAHLPGAATVAAAAARFDVGVYPLPVIGARSFGRTEDAERGLILGYSSLSPKEITAGVGLLGKAIATV